MIRLSRITFAPVLAALVFSTWVAAPAMASSVRFETVINWCEQVRKSGKAPTEMTRLLKPSSRLNHMEIGTVDTDVGRLYLTLVNNPRVNGFVGQVCSVEGARFDNGKWAGSVRWSKVQNRVAKAFEATKPKGAKVTKASLSKNQLEQMGFEFIQCGKVNSFWSAGPVYKSDGGFLFPPTAEWRLDEATVSITVLRPLLPGLSDQHCG
ncbi:hypothetical protein [uncultured Litoreibacter sp.]|uniref:hypothetical protein n=1 Tax=uncultured Litoreibacter sp. TaxID=1392394 RepID=UPI002623693E|nr:hypothetical protein [uncultured Litoreibacter sp.]